MKETRQKPKELKTSVLEEGCKKMNSIMISEYLHYLKEEIKSAKDLYEQERFRAAQNNKERKAWKLRLARLKNYLFDKLESRINRRSADYLAACNDVLEELCNLEKQSFEELG